MTFRSLVLTGVLAVALMASGTAQDVSRSGEISGTVITRTTPLMPIARVLVTISSDTLKPSRTTITDERGHFTFTGLPSGSFSIVAARPPYVKSAFGAKRPGRPGTPLVLAAAQHVTDVTIALAHGAAITGLIRNTSGEIAPGITVEAMTLDAQSESTVASAVTDDRGVYRIFGLSPERYVVSAKVSDRAPGDFMQLSDAQVDEVLARLQRRSGTAPTNRPAPTPTPTPPVTFGYAPIYYPGTPDPDQASSVDLVEGDDRGGIDIGLQVVRTAAIEGRVSFAGGALPSGTQITLTRLGLRGSAANPFSSPTTSRPPDAAGNFRFPGILPGKYRLVARAVTTTAPQTPIGAGSAAGSQPIALTGAFWALADVTVEGDDISGVALALQPGLRFSGRIAIDAHGQTVDPAAIRLRLVDVTGTSTFVPALGVARADGTFEMTGVLPGMYSAVSASTNSNLWLRSVVVDGRDILDFPLEVGPAGDVSGAVATFTDRHTELSGSLQTAANAPAPDYFIVVFSSDRAYWRPAARRIQFTRPSTDGRFAFRDLPAGDYRLAALTDLEATDLFDTTFLEGLLPGAVPVHLDEGEKRTQDVKIVR